MGLFQYDYAFCISALCFSARRTELIMCLIYRFRFFYQSIFSFIIFVSELLSFLLKEKKQQQLNGQQNVSYQSMALVVRVTMHMVFLRLPNAGNNGTKRMKTKKYGGKNTTNSIHKTNKTIKQSRKMHTRGMTAMCLVWFAIFVLLNRNKIEIRFHICRLTWFPIKRNWKNWNLKFKNDNKEEVEEENGEKKWYGNVFNNFAGDFRICLVLH